MSSQTPTTLNSETTLLSLGKWAMVSVKVPGYFPLSVKTSSVKFLNSFSYSKFQKVQYLSFSYCSLSAIYAMALLAVLSCWDLVFFAKQSSFNKYLKARGPTESYAYTIMLAISSLLGIYITIFGLRKASKFLKYWADCCNLFDQLQVKLGFIVNSNGDGGIDFDDGHQNVTTVERFYAIQKSIRTSFLTLVIPILLHVLIDYGYRVASSFFNKEDVEMDYEITELALGLGVWTFFALTGTGISIWLIFFIQFYTAALHAVADSLRALSISSNSNNNNNIIDIGGRMKKDQNFVDVDELFSRVILQPQHQQQMRRPERKIVATKVSSLQPIDLELELETILSLFQSIIGGIEEFNELFGVIIIFEMSACVFNLLVYLFFALVWLGRGELLLLMETAVPTYVYGKELYDMGTFSEQLTSSADIVVKTFADNVKLLSNLSPHMHLKLQMLTTQISTNPPIISAKQFFAINRELVTAVLSGLATFLVVLVQFRDADANAKPS